MLRRPLSIFVTAMSALLASPLGRPALFAQAAAPQGGGGEANLTIPDLSQVQFLGLPGRTLLMGGLVICALGLLFGLVIYSQLKNAEVHESMREISELIYETCKTYLITQGKFILILEIFIGAVIALYFGLLVGFSATKVLVILAFSLIGIGGAMAWPGSASASIRSPTHAPRLRRSAASRIRAIRSRSRPG